MVIKDLVQNVHKNGQNGIILMQTAQKMFIFWNRQILFLPESTEGVDPSQTTAMANEYTEKDV